MAIFNIVSFPNKTWWFSIAAWNYQRVSWFHVFFGGGHGLTGWNPCFASTSLTKRRGFPAFTSFSMGLTNGDPRTAWRAWAGPGVGIGSPGSHGGSFEFHYLVVYWNRGTTKSSTLIGFSIINHQFGVPNFKEWTTDFFPVYDQWIQSKKSSHCRPIGSQSCGSCGSACVLIMWSSNKAWTSSDPRNCCVHPMSLAKRLEKGHGKAGRFCRFAPLSRKVPVFLYGKVPNLTFPATVGRNPNLKAVAGRAPKKIRAPGAMAFHSFFIVWRATWQSPHWNHKIHSAESGMAHKTRSILLFQWVFI